MVALESFRVGGCYALEYSDHMDVWSIHSSSVAQCSNETLGFGGITK